MSGESRARRRTHSIAKTCKDQDSTDPSPPSHSKQPRIDVESFKLDDSSPPKTNTSQEHTNLETNGRSPSFGKLRMIGNYCVERTIGRGQFGKVKLAYHRKLPDMKVAIKIINKTKLDDDTLRMIQREVHIMKNLQHPNIIRLYEVLETPRTLYLIMEYAEGGEVMDFIIAHGKIPEREAKRFFAQMLSAVQYCHSKKCCHRDLKPENLLLDSNMNVKIIDFGLSNMFLPGSLMKTFCGSPTYASPELILRKEYLGPPVDVWSMGVVLFVLVCGYLPFDGHNFVDLFNKILKAQYAIPSHVSEGCSNLIERMLVVEPDQRATIDEIRRHPWLNSVQDCIPDIKTIEISDESKINPSILDELETLGFQRDEIVHSVLKNNFTDSAAMYFLLDAKRINQHRRASNAYITNTPSTQTTSSFLSPSVTTPPTTYSSSSPPPSPPTSPYVLPHSKSARHANEEVKRVGFNVQPSKGEKEGEKEGGERKSKASVHRRAASEAMKEQVLKQAKAQHELNIQKAAQYSTPQPRPVNYKLDEREAHTPTLQHSATTPVRHSMAVGAGWNTPQLEHHSMRAPNTPNISSSHPHHNDDDDGTVPPSPSKMSSIISSFKSMWRKDKSGKSGANSGDQPRIVRFAFHVNTMTDKSPDAIVDDVTRILKECGIAYTLKGKFCASCVVENVRFSIEVCRLPRLLVNGVRFSRISGSAWKYKTIVKDLVVHMKL